MKCVLCGSKMRKEREELYHFDFSGLDKVYLRNIDKEVCLNEECGDEAITIPRLQKLLETIAIDLASQKSKLLPKEIRYLRTYLGFSGADFAKKISVTPETVSRWEKGQLNMKDSVEMLLRILVLSKSGPFRNYDDLESFASTKRKTPVKRVFKAKKELWVPVVA